jgi:hypothetical protein
MMKFKLTKNLILASVLLISNNICAMQSQEESLMQACNSIIETYAKEFLPQPTQDIEISANQFIENIVADLLHCRKKFPAAIAIISNQNIARMLFNAISLKLFKLPIFYWINSPEIITRYFAPPLDEDVFEILTLVKCRLIIEKAYPVPPY